jgi:hypothetical protein
MCEVNPELSQNVTYENGKKILYMWILKALYGCVESALLWYQLYWQTLKNMGFELNPHDRCIANRMVNGKQQTVCWYVDDNKISHDEYNVNTEVLKAIEKHFGKLSVTRGKKHMFLGMLIELLGDGKFSIDVSDHLNEACEDFGEDLSKKTSTPATKRLHFVNVRSPKLDEEKATKFHSIVSKLLWTAKRGRPDIDTTISFLCTRVSKCTREDWYKLKRVLQYLRTTIDDRRVVGADDLSSLFIWIDAAYAVHPDMRSHTGGTMSYGWGIIHH